MPQNFSELAHAAKTAQVDAAGLESALRRHLRGEVRFDAGSRALYATDGSNYRQVPIGVVLPRDADDVVAAITLAREFSAPILCRGGGTSLAGQCCNVAVVLDFSKYMAEILEVDPARRVARVQPGVILDHLRNAAEKHHLTFAPDPASHDRCTLGGMIGNNSCGVHSIMAGKTEDNVEKLEILTYDGLRMKVGETSDQELDAIIRKGGRRGGIYAALKSLRDKYGDLVRQRYPNIPRRVSGYNLNFLLPENGFHVARALVGSEGTCVTVLEATCRLVESPPARVLLVIAYPDVYQCADRVPEVMTHSPIGLEGIDDLLVQSTRRKGINSEGLALLPEGGGWLFAEFGGDAPADAEAKAHSLMDALEKNASPPQMRLFTDSRQVRHVWEIRESSLGVLAYVPGEPFAWEGWEDSAVAPEKLGDYLRDLRKLVEPYRLDENLRLGADYRPWQPQTHFQFPQDHGSLVRATQRCVGVGKCRHHEGGLMCPSFRVTREEEHSTRGRAHLLWEMTKGEVVQDGWQSDEVKDSLDLCLSCKGCKSDCPVGVDLATYKAEFLSHYYEGRMRPLSAYAFGNIDIWARVASIAPGLVNFATQAPLLRDIAKKITGMARQRKIPAFARETFREWFRRRVSPVWGRGSAPSRRVEDPPPHQPSQVMLWPDTFNNYFHPHTTQAAVDVLEAARFHVTIPRATLCCGRPLYDFGMLDRAKKLLLRTLDSLAPEIEAGVPIVVLEPSCAAVFRDELLNLFPKDSREIGRAHV